MIAEIVVVALVAYRVFRLLGVDTIGDSVRPDWAWLSCAWCLGSWVAIAVSLATSYWGLTDTSLWLLIPASATLVGLIGNYDHA
jgi:hypothetical protein